MKRLAYVAVIAGLTAIAPPADAGLLELDAQIHAGGQAGKGWRGARQDEAFHDHSSGAGYGALVGVEFLFIDVWIEHNQFVNDARDSGSGIHGTWTQFMTGMDVQFDIGDKAGQPPAQGEKDKRHYKTYAALGVGVGFGVGTGQQVDPPLDNAQITDKGAVGQAHLDFGYRLNEVMSIGIHIPVQVNWLVRNDTTANDNGNWYGEYNVAGFVTLRANFAIK